MADPVQPESNQQASDAALEELNRVWTIARIFSSTAHDVNNALQVISGSAELLESREGLDPIVLRRVQAIRNQTARASESIDRLLTYTRRANAAVQAVDIMSIVEAAMAMRSFTLTRASIAIDCTRSDDQPYRVPVEPPAILQALLTLLIFFEKALAPRAPARIALSLERSAGAIVLTLTGESEKAAAPEGDVDAWAGDPLAAGQLEAVRCLIARQRGTVAIDADGWRLRTATITLPGS